MGGEEVVLPGNPGDSQVRKPRRFRTAGLSKAADCAAIAVAPVVCGGGAVR